MTRVSSEKNDPGYAQLCAAAANGKRTQVFLNGKEISYCITADEEQGFVVRCVLNRFGKIQLNPVDKSRVWTERVVGKVEVRFA
jgi:hypothetical protein